MNELKPISHASRLLGHLLCGGRSQKRKNQSEEGHLLQSFRQTMNMTNTWWTLGRYILQFGQIHFIFWTNTFYILDIYISYFGQIHFILLKNTFYIFDKYIFPSKSGRINHAGTPPPIILSAKVLSRTMTMMTPLTFTV